MRNVNGGIVVKRNGLSAVGGMMCGIFGMSLGGVIFLGGFICGAIIASNGRGGSRERRAELHEVRNEEHE